MGEAASVVRGDGDTLKEILEEIVRDPYRFYRERVLDAKIELTVPDLVDVVKLVLTTGGPYVYVEIDGAYGIAKHVICEAGKGCRVDRVEHGVLVRRAFERITPILVENVRFDKILRDFNTIDENEY